jgi:hypothetical protein
MILESLVGLSLVLNVSLESPPTILPERNPQQLSVPQKQAALRPLVERATRCIAGRAVSDPRYRPDLRRDEINDLIADSLDACRDAVDDLVEAHDRMYGDGSGEAFLLGPYFDRLPAAVLRQARTRARANSR